MSGCSQYTLSIAWRSLVNVSETRSQKYWQVPPSDRRLAIVSSSSTALRSSIGILHACSQVNVDECHGQFIGRTSEVCWLRPLRE